MQLKLALQSLPPSFLPKTFCIDFFETAVYLINRMPTKVLNHIYPYEKLTGCAPNYSHLRVFECICYPYMRPWKSNKLDYRTQNCIFLGYSSSHHNYLSSNPLNNKKVISCHVVFSEEFYQGYTNSNPSSSPGMSSSLLPIP